MTTASRFKMPELKLPEFKLPEIPEIKAPEMPELKLPEMPDLKVPQFLADLELPHVDLSALEPVVGFARDAVYVAVGLAVMTTERLQTLQQQWIDGMNEQIKSANEQVRTTVDSIKDRISA